MFSDATLAAADVWFEESESARCAQCGIGIEDDFSFELDALGNEICADCAAYNARHNAKHETEDVWTCEDCGEVIDTYDTELDARLCTFCVGERAWEEDVQAAMVGDWERILGSDRAAIQREVNRRKAIASQEQQG